MTNQDNKSFMDNIVDAQKQTVDTLVENTRKFANGNTMVNETIEKGSEWYKNWLESQKNVLAHTANQAQATTEKAKENTSKMNEFYQNWFNTQMNMAKQTWDMNSNLMKNAASNNGTVAADANPMAQWTNAMNNWSNWMNNMNQGANWMNQVQQFQNQFQNANPFNMEAWKKSSDDFTGIFNKYYEVLNTNFTEWQKNIQNGTVQDAYRNMVNVTDGFTRFYEMWTPMWKSIQDKTFNMDMYKQMANPAMYKDLMDKYFGFMPENTRQYAQGITDMMNNGMKQYGQAGVNQFQQMRGMMANMPGANASEMFSNLLNGYNTFTGMMNSAVAPFTKMITPNQYTKSTMEWNDIANRIMVYNIKNAELQYVIYNQGTKVMDQLAENISNKLQSDEEVNSMMALYQEWLNISDKVYVSLFESDEYSKLMAEVSALQLTLRKDMETQMEKSLAGIPVATRSEMEEMYKTIYDLKKQVRDLERNVEYNNTKVAVVEAVVNSEEHNTEAGEEKTRRAKKA